MFCGSVILTSMFLLYWHVLKREKANDRYRLGDRRKPQNRTYSNRVAMQGICYVWAFLLTWCTWIALVILLIKGDEVPFGLHIASMVLQPLQGFFNSMVYLRPRYIQYSSYKALGRTERPRGCRSWVQRARLFFFPVVIVRQSQREHDEDLSSLPSMTWNQEEDDIDADAVIEDVDPSVVFLLSPQEEKRLYAPSGGSTKMLHGSPSQKSLALAEPAPAAMERIAEEESSTDQQQNSSLEMESSDDGRSTGTLHC